MMAPVVITFGCPVLHRLVSDAGSGKRQANLPAMGWTGISAASEGSESIAGGRGGLVVLLVVVVAPIERIVADNAVPVMAVGAVPAAGMNWTGR